MTIPLTEGSEEFADFVVNLLRRGDGAFDLVPNQFAESAAHVGKALLYNTVTIGETATSRGLTSVSFDDRPRMRRWVAGNQACKIFHFCRTPQKYSWRCYDCTRLFGGWLD